MSDIDNVRAVTCPSCGARVQMAEDQYQTTCKYCGTLLERPRPAPPVVTPTIIQTPMYTAPETIEVHTGRWGLFSIVLTLILLGAAGIGIYAALQSSGITDLSQITSAFNPLRASAPALIISGGDSGQLDALIYTYDTSKDARFLSYVDGSSHAVRWQTDPLGKDTYRVPMAASGKLVYAMDKTRVMALNRQTGQVAWEASVSDELPYSCYNDCLRVVGQRVVVLAKDGGLYGLDAQSGRVVWNTHLKSTPDQLYLVNDQIAVFDQPDKAVVLSIIDPADGSERQTLKPICSGSSSSFTDDPSLNSPVLVDPDQKSLYILFGFFNSCVQRWDAATGRMTWNASIEDASFASGFGPRSMLSGGTIYVANENQLVTISMADGKWRKLIDDPNYEFTPLAAQDGVLITRAKRTRGTTRFEMWGVDTTTGKQVWQHPFTGSEPLDEPDRKAGLIEEGESAWTAHLTPKGLVVVQAMAQPHQLSVETLNPANGVSSGQTPVPLTGIVGDFYSVPDVVGWTNDTSWLVVEGRLYALNLANSTLVYSWP